MAETYVELMSGWRLNDDGTLRADMQTVPAPDDPDPRGFDPVVVGTVVIPVDQARSTVRFPLTPPDES